MQRLMYVARVRAVGEGREDYNYTYDLFLRRYPEVVKGAERISSADACATLLARALELCGAATEKQIARLFEWEDAALRRAIARCEGEGLVRREGGRLVLPSLAR